MDEKKKLEGTVAGVEVADFNADYANRARNRTVMLTPEMTGKMRAKLIGPEGEGTEPSMLTRTINTKPEPEENGWEQPTPRETESVPVTAAGTESAEAPDSEWATESPLFEATNEPGVVPVPEHQSRNGKHIHGEEEEEAPVSVKQRPQQTRATQRAPQAAQTAELDQISYQTKNAIAGFLVTYDRDPLGEYIALRAGRIIVSCELETKGNCFVIHHPSISSMHAIMRVALDQPIQVLDQLSETGTKIIKVDSGEELLLSGEKGTLVHGDIVVFGECGYHVCLLRGNAAGAAKK